MKRNKKRLISCLLALLLCLACFPSAYAMGDDPEPLPVPEQETEVQEQEQGTVIAQKVQYDETTNKQFISISDRAGNIFYLIIDYDAPVDEDEEMYTTYFLNPVDTEDLNTLLGVEETAPPVCSCKERCQPGEVNMDCELCAMDMTQCLGEEPEPEKPTETPAPETSLPQEPEKVETNPGPALLVLMLAVLGIAAGIYFKLGKGRNKTPAKNDFEDYDFGEDEEYENEEEEDENHWVADK